MTSWPWQLIFSPWTHTFNFLDHRTTCVSWYQKGKTNLDFTGARVSEWQWHQLDRMQVCTSLQTDNHASTPPLSFYRPDALPAAQPTVSKHGRQLSLTWILKCCMFLHVVMLSLAILSCEQTFSLMSKTVPNIWLLYPQNNNIHDLMT